jgi:hypothetical protein
MRILLFVSLITCVLPAVGQDLLITKSGDTTKAIVLTVYYDNIQYRKFGDANGPVLTVSKYDLSRALYANGQVDDFTKFVKPPIRDIVKTTMGLDSSQVYYSLGTKDAFRYYKGYKSFATTVYITTTLFFPLGLFIASASGGDDPIDACELPNEKFLINPYYVNGYVAGAKKRKSLRMWSNFFFGFGTAFVAGLIITSTQK